jgi:hypothetical protein
MVSRALGLAAVMLLMVAGLAAPVQAQENLDAGKSPSQLFGGNCSACHKSPRGLLKTVAPGSLPGFLRQHYTTGPEMAGVLSSYLVSNGAGDTRYMGNQGKGTREGGKDAKSDAKPETSAASSDQPRRFGRRHRSRSAAEPTEARQAAPTSEAAGADAEAKPRHHGRKAGKHKRGKKPAGDEAETPNGAREAPSDAGRVDATQPASDLKSTAAERSSEPPRIEAPKDSEPAPTRRADPSLAAAPSPTTTQSIPATSSAGGSDPSIPTAPSH